MKIRWPGRGIGPALLLSSALAPAPVFAADCAAHLKVLGVTSDEARFWSRKARSRDAFFAISSTLRLAEEAPADVWDLLAVARLGPLEPVEPFVDEFNELLRGQPGLEELEVLFDLELRELRIEIGALLALHRYGSRAAQHWIDRLARVPIRLFVLARVLADFPGADYNDKQGFTKIHDARLIKLNLARVKRWMAPDRSWRGLIAGSRLLAANLVDRRFVYYQLEKRAVTVDAEQMVGWVVDRLTGGSGPSTTDRVPAHWAKFYARLFDAVDGPAHRQTKFADGLTEGEQTMTTLLHVAGHELVSPIVKANLGGEWVPGTFAGLCVVRAFETEMIHAEGGARALGLMLDSLGLSFPRGGDLRTKFAARLAASLGDALRTYFPVGGRSIQPESAESEDHEAEAPVPPRFFPARSPAADVVPTVTPGQVDDLPEFSDIQPDRTYFVHFSRPHAKFTGPQRVRFTLDALEEIAEHAEVEPDAWLEALRMGIALSHGQRGVKLLVFGVKRAPGGGRPAKIKLLLSNYWVTGEFCGGEWVFTGLAKGH